MSKSVTRLVCCFTADSGISDTEDEEKPAGKQPTSIKTPENESKETLGAAEEEKPALTEKAVPALVESQVTPAAMESESVEDRKEETPASSSNEPEKEVAPSEEDTSKGIDVESVVSEVKTVEMKLVEDASDVIPPATEERIVAESSEMTTTQEASPPCETLETPVSDKKRPLEKVVGEDEDDDSEHSPEAKQPRIFSPDKVCLFLNKCID